jgi:hypothetical protein
MATANQRRGDERTNPKDIRPVSSLVTLTGASAVSSLFRLIRPCFRPCFASVSSLGRPSGCKHENRPNSSPLGG